MTIKDIAIISDVALDPYTVIHKRGGVSEEKKKIINDIIKENNFKINSVASALAKTNNSKLRL